MTRIIKRIKWWFLKQKLFKINRKNGGDLDGDIVTYRGRKYVVVNSLRRVEPTNVPASYISLAKEVIDGHFGNGIARKKQIESLGYDYDLVQSAVNVLLK